MKLSLVSMGLLALAACSKDPTSTTQTTAVGTTAKDMAKDKDVDLAPLPLKLKMPADEGAVVMDMSLGEIKSASVSFDAVSAGINVSVPIEKSFADEKKTISGDTVLFPFKRWVQQSDHDAIEEFTSEGKSGFIAYAWKTIGGKSYVCKSNGLAGLKSEADAKKVLAVCDTLAAK